jgi:hypothetical protein
MQIISFWQAKEPLHQGNSLTIKVPVAGPEVFVFVLEPGLAMPKVLVPTLPGRMLSSGPRSIFKTLPLQFSNPTISLAQRV